VSVNVDPPEEKEKRRGGMKGGNGDRSMSRKRRKRGRRRRGKEERGREEVGATWRRVKDERKRSREPRGPRAPSTSKVCGCE